MKIARGRGMPSPAEMGFGEMLKETYLVIGLGNAGEKYKNTRHNVGFEVVDILAHRLNIKISKRKSEGLIGEGIYHNKRVVLVKPQTFMNNSGRCIAPLVQWFKAEMSQLIIVYDDIDLPEGQLRVRKSGSAGTHNGMRSVIAHLGKQDFPRVRVGIGKKPEGWELADWVLSKYQSSEAEKVAFESYESAADAIQLFLDEGIENAMQVFNRKEKKGNIE